MSKRIELSLPEELLGLSDVEILEAKITSGGDIIIRVKSTKEEIPCHRCGKPTKPYGKGRTLLLRHLPIMGRKTYIEITPPRGICEDCDKHPTTTQVLSWYTKHARYTKAYEQYTLLSLINSTIADVSIKEEIGETAIQNIVDRHISDKVDWKSFKRIGFLGIDEIALKKGYKDYVSVITSRQGGRTRILAVLKDREKADIKKFLSSIPKKKRKTIIAVCCDMYDGYIEAAKEAFNKTIPVVVDRFHVAKLYRKALVDIRKKELARLKRELSEDEYKLLKSSIAILVKKQECYTKEEKIQLEKLFRYSPALKAAYKPARQLTAVFNTHHRKTTGMNKINEWIVKAESSNLSSFVKFAQTLTKYKDEISNYFVRRDTSGFVEGLNNKIKVIKRRCYGIFDIKHFFQRIFLDLEGYGKFLIPQGVSAVA